MNAWHKKLRIEITNEEKPPARSLIMDWQSPRNKKWIRLVAIVLVVTFINQDIIWAQGGTPTWSKGQNGSFSFKTPVNVDGNITVPKDFAVTKEVYTAPGDKTIINIQDAHASLGAQESIASILDSLVTNYDLKLVAVEGSAGYIDTSILRTFPDENIRKNTARYFMREGKMSAGEFFAITSSKPIALYGIEDRSLYLENAEQFRKVHEINNTVQKDLAALLGDLKTLRKKIYSPELEMLTENSVLNRDGKISFSKRWEFVRDLASKTGSDYKRYENLTKLVESLKLEKLIDFKKANSQRDALIDALSKMVTKQGLEQIILKSIAFKTGKISQSEYYIFLQEQAQRAGLGVEPYKDLIAYTDYITLYESIDLTEIFEEARRFEDQIKEKLFTNDYQRKLYEISKCVEFVRDLFELKLTNGDFAFLASHRDVCDPRAIASFLKEASQKYSIAIEANYDLGKIFDNMPVAMDFYTTAEKRNETMLANTIKRMAEEGQTIAALVTGGYHSKGITELLRQRRTSYIVILPKFEASKGGRHYVAILTNKKDAYTNLLESGKYQLLTDEYLKKGIADPAVVMGFIRDIVITSLGQAAIQRQDVDSVKKLWVDSYKNSYEGLKNRGIITASATEIQKERPIKPRSIDENGKTTGDAHIAVTTSLPTNEPVSVERFAEVVYSIDAARLGRNEAIVKFGDGQYVVIKDEEGAISRREATKADIKEFEKQRSRAVAVPAGAVVEEAAIETRVLAVFEEQVVSRLEDILKTESEMKDLAQRAEKRDGGLTADNIIRELRRDGVQITPSLLKERDGKISKVKDLVDQIVARCAELRPAAPQVVEAPALKAEPVVMPEIAPAMPTQAPAVIPKEGEVAEQVGGEIIPDVIIVEEKERAALQGLISKGATIKTSDGVVIPIAELVKTIDGMTIVDGAHVQDIIKQLGVTITGRFMTEYELIRRAEAEHKPLPYEAIKEAEAALPGISRTRLHGNIRIVDGMDKMAKLYFLSQDEWYILIDRRAIEDGHLKPDVREFDIPHEGYHIILRSEFGKFGRSIKRGAEEEVLATLLTLLRLIAFFRIHDGSDAKTPRLVALFKALGINPADKVNVSDYAEKIIQYIKEVGGPVVAARTVTGEVERYAKYHSELVADAEAARLAKIKGESYETIRDRVVKDMEYYTHRHIAAMIKHLVSQKMTVLSAYTTSDERILRIMLSDEETLVKSMGEIEDLARFIGRLADLPIQYLATGSPEQPYAMPAGYDALLGVSPASKDLVEILAVAGEDSVIKAQKSWKDELSMMRDRLYTIVADLKKVRTSSPETDISPLIGEMRQMSEAINSQLKTMEAVALGQYTQAQLLDAVEVSSITDELTGITSEVRTLNVSKLPSLEAQPQPAAAKSLEAELEHLRKLRDILGPSGGFAVNGILPLVFSIGVLLSLAAKAFAAEKVPSAVSFMPSIGWEGVLIGVAIAAVVVAFTGIALRIARKTHQANPDAEVAARRRAEKLSGVIKGFGIRSMDTMRNARTTVIKLLSMALVALSLTACEELGPDKGEGPSSYAADQINLPTARFSQANSADNMAVGEFSYDNFATTPVEIVDLSGGIIFGLCGDTDVVLVKITDANGNYCEIKRHGIEPSVTKVFDIPASDMEGIDPAQVKSIVFMADESIYIVASGGREYHTSPLAGKATSTAGQPNIPAPASYTTFSAPNSSVSGPSAITGGVQVDYQTGKEGWAGVGLSYGGINLSGYDNIILAINIRNDSGKVEKVKVEIEDASGNKVSMPAPAGTVSLPLSAFGAGEQFDWTRVRFISVVVDTSDVKGSLTVGYSGYVGAAITRRPVTQALAMTAQAIRNYTAGFTALWMPISLALTMFFTTAAVSLAAKVRPESRVKPTVEKVVKAKAKPAAPVVVKAPVVAAKARTPDEVKAALKKEIDLYIQEKRARTGSLAVKINRRGRLELDDTDAMFEKMYSAEEVSRMSQHEIDVEKGSLKTMPQRRLENIDRLIRKHIAGMTDAEWALMPAYMTFDPVANKTRDTQTRDLLFAVWASGMADAVEAESTFDYLARTGAEIHV
ncbi:MAG: hypothetical protein NC933_02910, partial [Candidatus Omnitrophica bacterium]|nr:hypothetical protein [Candidatus Omnitrophota bacterium]